MSVLDAAGKDKIANHDAVVRAIAIAVATGSCVIHGVWRQGGIYLNNLLAVMKIVILLMIFILGMLAHNGTFGPTNGAIKTSKTFGKYFSIDIAMYGCVFKDHNMLTSLQSVQMQMHMVTLRAFWPFCLLGEDSIRPTMLWAKLMTPGSDTSGLLSAPLPSCRYFISS